MVSNIAPCPYPALKMWFIDHVIVVSAFIVPEVVAKDGLFRDPLGSVNVKLKVEFHQFWFCAGFCAPENDCA